MSEFYIREAETEDCDLIWERIKNVTPSELGKNINDYNIYHSKKSLENVLSDDTSREKILLALDGGKLVGIADFSYCYPDYLFFESEFGYIRYLITDNFETQKTLYDEIKERLKNSNIRYVVKDLWTSEEKEYKDYQTLGMKKQRTRLYKELEKEKQ